MTVEIQTETRHRVRCDKCGTRTSGVAGILTQEEELRRAQEEALRSAQEKGWRRETWWDGMKNVSADFCPTCLKEREAEQKVKLGEWVGRDRNAKK